MGSVVMLLSFANMNSFSNTMAQDYGYDNYNNFDEDMYSTSSTIVR